MNGLLANRSRIVRRDGTIRDHGRAYRVIHPGFAGRMVTLLTLEEGHLTFEYGDQTYVAERVHNPQPLEVA